jgi:hypothetical protein
MAIEEIPYGVNQAEYLGLSGKHAQAFEDIYYDLGDVPVYSSQSGKHFALRSARYGDLFLALLIVYEGKVVEDPMMSVYELAGYLMGFSEDELYMERKP